MGMSKDTQMAALRAHLADGLSITSLEAFHLYGISRLSSLVYYLKKQGWKIQSTTIRVPTRYGKDAHVAEYRLEVEE